MSNLYVSRTGCERNGQLQTNKRESFKIAFLILKNSLLFLRSGFLDTVYQELDLYFRLFSRFVYDPQFFVLGKTRIIYSLKAATRFNQRLQMKDSSLPLSKRIT